MRTLGSDVGATILNQDIYELSKTQKHRLGTRVVRGDAVYRYAHCKTAYLSNERAVRPYKLHMVRNAAIPTAPAVGASQVIVTVHTDDGALNTGVIAAHELTGGRVIFLVAYTDANVSSWLNMGIRDNTAVGSAGGAMTITLDGELPLVPTYCEEIIANPYRNLIWSGIGGGQGTANNALFVGVPVRLATADLPYHWVQTWGPVRVSCEATVKVSGSTGDQRADLVINDDGAFKLCITDNDYTYHAQRGGVGMCMLEAGTQAAPFVYLQIAP